MEHGENLFEKFVKSIKNEQDKIGHANIIISGKTGVGKSTLVNAAFRDNMAETGIGRPVTRECRLIEKEGMPLRIYDTVGLELNRETQNETISSIRKLIQDKVDAGKLDDCIHCMWYCVNSMGDRLEPEEETFIKEIAEKIPVIIVLTKTYYKKKANQLKQCIEELNLPAKNIIVTLAQDFEDDDDNIKPAFGVDLLVEFTESILPEAAKSAWVNVQKASKKLKRAKSTAVVLATAATSFGEGYMPLPFSQCAVLIPTQIGMIASITVIYGLEINKAMLTGIVSSLIGTSGTTLTGKTIVGNLLKLIPGVGTILGGTISGATAALLTVALGETYIAIMEKILTVELDKDSLTKDSVKEQMRAIFRDMIAKYKNKKLI